MSKVTTLAVITILILVFLQGMVSAKKSKSKNKGKGKASKVCKYNGVEYQSGEEVFQGKDNCCKCGKRSGKFRCSTATCYTEEGCARTASTHGACCPACECKDAAGKSYNKKERWTNTVDGVCYECKCKKDKTASCKAKKCKSKCQPDEVAETRFCCVCGRKLKQKKAPPKKFADWKSIQEFMKTNGSST